MAAVDSNADTRSSRAPLLDRLLSSTSPPTEAEIIKSSACAAGQRAIHPRRVCDLLERSP
jgi:hypothetical protein